MVFTDVDRRERQGVAIDVDGLGERDGMALRTRDAADRFDRFLKQGVDRMFLRHTGPTPVVFDFQLDEGPWWIPWELAATIFGGPTPRESFTPVRRLGPPVQVGPTRSAEELRVLIVKGHPGSVPNRIDPSREAAGVIAAWGRLDPDTRSRIARPREIDLGLTALSDTIREWQPHILWYCGHGRSSPEPALLQSDATWLPAARFAGAIPPDAVPAVCVLWACELGEAGEHYLDQATGPEIHRALAARGVRATLAMQSRIDDRVARSMATEMFRRIAAGSSLERAAVYARCYGHDLPAPRLDWAAPAVWLTDEATLSWHWGEAPGDPLLERMVSWSTLRGAPALPEADEHDVHALHQATLWTQWKRVIVQADTGAQAAIVLLGRVADSVVRQLRTDVVCIRMNKASPLASISDWAKDVAAWCDSRSLSTELGLIVQHAIADPVFALRALLAKDDLMLVFVDPPTGPDERWFTDVVASSGRSGPIVMVTGHHPATDEFDGWTQDALYAEDQIDGVRDASGATRQTLLVMATLDLPFPEAALSSIGFDREVFPRGTPYLIETALGPLLSASAKTHILQGSDAESRRAAHEECLSLLERANPDPDPWEYLRHLVGSDRRREALDAAAALIRRSASDGRNAAAIEGYELLKPLGAARRDLDALTMTWLAQAYVSVGKLDRARLVCPPTALADPLTEGWRLALLSELEKSSAEDAGWRERSMHTLTAAIRSCDEARRVPGLRNDATALGLRLRMNRARLRHYLFYELEAAEAAYREILAEASRTDAILAATTERNLAECVFERGHRSPSARQEGLGLLASAYQRLSTMPEQPLRADVLYTQARLHDDAGAESDLLDRCIVIARETGNGMVENIAEARLFWLTQSFSLERWTMVELGLAPYGRHGWALRTTMNGRIRAAKKLVADDCRTEALTLLRRNLQEYESHPELDGGSDRDRFAQTVSGVLAISTDAAEREHWRRRAEDASWLPQWLSERGVGDIASVWAEVG